MKSKGQHYSTNPELLHVKELEYVLHSEYDLSAIHILQILVKFNKIVFLASLPTALWSIIAINVMVWFSQCAIEFYVRFPHSA